MDSKETLDLDVAVDRLGRGPGAVVALFDGLPDAFARWKPASDRWSLLEVVNHLADEEVLDFRTRIERTLRDPLEPWPSIAPQEWVVERKYNARDLRESLERFLGEREQSLEWLRTQGKARWTNVHVHPKFGPMSAKYLLANWIAHDILHARQMLRLHYEHLANLVAPDKLDYAGPW